MVNGDADPEEGADAAGRPWDRGLQPERTVLAWQRSGLATAVAAVAALRLAIRQGDPLAATVAAVALGGAIAAAVQALLGYRRLTRRLTLGVPPGTTGPLPVQVVAVVLLGVAGVLLATG